MRTEGLWAPCRTLRRALAAAGASLIAACTSVGPTPTPTAAPVARLNAATAPSSQAAEAQVRGYRLGPGDVLDISVYNNPDLATKAQVGQDGDISFPLIGNVHVAGLTRAQVAKTIANRLDAGGFVPKPDVNILISDYQSQTVSVLGNVNKPGTYQISNPVNVTQVLAMAGGITDKGSTVVTLLKKGVDGVPQRQTIDIQKMVSSGDLAQDVSVKSGDVVYVPPAPLFYIYGEVRNPGAYPLTSGMTVQEALSVGGGLTVRGTERGIELDRKGPDGRPENHTARLSERLEPGDVLHVPESWF